MKFGDIDRTVFDFGQSQDDDDPAECYWEYRGILEFKVCKATKGTGGGGRVDASKQNVDKIRIRSKKNYPKYTCKSAEDHLTTKCVCVKAKEKLEFGTAMNIGKCDDKGWQEYTYRARKYAYYECVDAQKAYDLKTPEYPCKGCVAKEYDKEYDLTSVFNNSFTDGFVDNDTGNPVLINYRNDDCSRGSAYHSWWCSKQSRLLFDYASKVCGGLISVPPDAVGYDTGEQHIGLTPEVQDCLLETLACDHPRGDIKAAIMSMFTAALQSGLDDMGDADYVDSKKLFPGIDCKTGDRPDFEDEIDENPRCK